MTTYPDGQIELPKYRCHKVVHALKIESLQLVPMPSDAPAPPHMTIVFEDRRFAPLVKPDAWLLEKKVKAGGYYVIYEDGYDSFSPADVFEDGYSPVMPKLMDVADNPLIHYEDQSQRTELALARDAAVNDKIVVLIAIATPRGNVGVSQHLFGPGWVAGEDGDRNGPARAISNGVITALSNVMHAERVKAPIVPVPSDH